VNVNDIGLFLIRIVGGGVHIGCPCGTVAMYWPIVPVPGDCEDGEVGGMKCSWQEKPKYSEKTCPGAILTTTNPNCQIRARTRPAAVGNQRLTASAMARPQHIGHCSLKTIETIRAKETSQSALVPGFQLNKWG
jgi:hypothetical protein